MTDPKRKPEADDEVLKAMEARAAYQLRHPNIVEGADLDQDEGSQPLYCDGIRGRPKPPFGPETR